MTLVLIEEHYPSDILDEIVTLRTVVTRKGRETLEHHVKRAVDGFCRTHPDYRYEKHGDEVRYYKSNGMYYTFRIEYFAKLNVY